MRLNSREQGVPPAVHRGGAEVNAPPPLIPDPTAPAPTVTNMSADDATVPRAIAPARNLPDGATIPQAVAGSGRLVKPPAGRAALLAKAR